MCWLHSSVFEMSMFEALTKSLNFNRVLCIFFRLKCSNWLKQITLKDWVQKNAFQLVIWWRSKLCCQHITLLLKNSRRLWNNEIVWSFTHFNILTEVSAAINDLNRSVWLFWNRWSQSFWHHWKRSRTEEKLKFFRKLRQRNKRFCMKRSRIWELDF